MKSSPVISRREMLQAGTAASLLTGSAAASAADAVVAVPTAPQPSIPPDRLRVAFLMDDGTTMIDFAGPWEVFQDAKTNEKKRAFYLYSVGPERKVYNTTGNGGGVGLAFMPRSTYADAPQPDIVVIPAQDGANGDAKVAWLKRVEPNAKVLMSVCTGAFWLAEAGFLDGKTATTHHEFYDMLKEQYPKVDVIRGRRFVDNGKIITAGGLTSGIDAALHVVERLVGKTSAQATAVYMEHDSSEWSGGVRARS